MIIFWRGKGFLVALFVFGCSLIANLVTDSITGARNTGMRTNGPLELL